LGVGIGTSACDEPAHVEMGIKNFRIRC